MKTKLPWTPAIITGFTVPIFATAFFAIIEGLNHNKGWGINPMNIRGVAGLITLVILGIGVYSGMQQVKRQQTGRLTYGEAFKTGIFIALVTAVISATGSFIYCTFINPGFADYMVQETRRLMLQQGVPVSQMTGQLQAIHQQFSTPIQVMQSFVGQFAGGTILTAIIAFFTRTKNN